MSDPFQLKPHLRAWVLLASFVCVSYLLFQACKFLVHMVR